MTRKTFLLILLCLFVIVIVSKLFLYDTGYSNPLYFSKYSQSGYYEIFPETMLDSLNRGETDIFIPASDELLYRDDPQYEVIHWSQSDYLKIVDALSREVWHEPLDLNEWKILYLYLTQHCIDNPQGFYTFSIVYFQNLGIEFWNRQYQARLIEVYSWQGLIRWADATFSDAILPGWGSIDLNNFKITAEDALLIAERNGGSKVRQEADNRCSISVWINNYPPVIGYTNNDWLVDYGMAGFYTRINPFSGKFRSNSPDE